MNMDRRKLENTALRDLVNALTAVIDTRDALWSLNSLDRLFRFKKYKKVISSYDHAMLELRNAIHSVTFATRQAEDALPAAKRQDGDRKPCISMEEFEMLLGNPELEKKLPKKKQPDSVGQIPLSKSL